MHFIICIFALDIYFQYLGNICRLEEDFRSICQLNRYIYPGASFYSGPVVKLGSTWLHWALLGLEPPKICFTFGLECQCHIYSHQHSFKGSPIVQNPGKSVSLETGIVNKGKMKTKSFIVRYFLLLHISRLKVSREAAFAFEVTVSQ